MMTSRETSTTEEKWQRENTRITDFCVSKDTLKVKDHPWSARKYLIYRSDKEFIFRTYKNFLELSNRKADNPSKKRVKGSI